MESWSQGATKPPETSEWTMEREEDGTIPILDVHMKRDGDKLTTSVYRKPTHTDCYLNYDLHHHPKVHPAGIVDGLSNRAKRICKKGSACQMNLNMSTML